jgi:signal transduction histidine kinase
MKDTDIRLVIAEALSSSKLPENIKIVSDVSSDLARFTGDSDFLKRIMCNLVLNAAQAMPNGGTLTIQAHKELQTADVVLTVEDTGVGIADDVKEKMFTPMFTTKSKGQGFGLAVIKRIVEALGGNISYESQVGKGTKFTVRLPPPPRDKR